MSKPPDHTEIRQWLAERGHSREEVERIMRQLENYDAQAVRDSIFDSIDTGQFNIEQVIREALGEEEGS